MSGWFEVAAGCTLGLVSTTLEPAPDGWAERTRIEVNAGDADCDHLRVPLPAGTRLERVHAVIRQGDGITRRLRDQTVHRSPRGLRGEALATVLLPSLLSGDRAVVDIERHWVRDGALDWSPAGALHGELSVRDGTVEPAGRLTSGKRGWWISEASDADGATVSAPGLEGAWTHPDAALLPPSVPPTVRRDLTIQLPPGDPQQALYPGGGSRVLTRLTLDFVPEERDRSWWVPTGEARSELELAVEPSDGAASVHARPDGWIVDVPASEGPATVTLVWSQADAPTFGEPAPDEALTVDAPDGRVVVEDSGAWFLAGIDRRAILPSREALVRGLDRRWRNAAIPEPGLPNELRGGRPSLHTATLIPLSLWDRVEPMDWGTDPLFVRRLVKARKTGGLTPTETGVVAWMYAEQARIPARWVLVRPAWAGPGGSVSPAGYTEMLVRLEIDGEHHWLDPACTACVPFEIRPELEGADAIGWKIEATPEPTEGRWTAVHGEDWVRWELVGPAALELRRWLEGVPIEERYRALAERMAGPGAELVEAKGLDLGEPALASRYGSETSFHPDVAAGEPVVGATVGGAVDDDDTLVWDRAIRLAARGGDGVRATPLALPPARQDGTVWVDWIGTREWIHDGEPMALSEERPGLRVTRRGSEDGRVVDRVEVFRRLLNSDDLDALDLLEDGAGGGERPPPDDGDPATETPPEEPAPASEAD